MLQHLPPCKFYFPQVSRQAVIYNPDQKNMNFECVQQLFENMRYGMAFDSPLNLYLVTNSGCCFCSGMCSVLCPIMLI